MLCLMQLGQSWLAGQQVLCAVLLAAQLATQANGQEAAQVPPFKLVAALLQVLLAERNCKSVALDPGAFNRYLTDHGIDALILSRAGPYSAEVPSAARAPHLVSLGHGGRLAALASALGIGLRDAIHHVPNGAA